MWTTLYEKVFLDGFHKPSYVVASLLLCDPVPTERELEDAIVRTLVHHPRLRSYVVSTLGVPTHFSLRSAEAWRSEVGLRVAKDNLHTLEERLLSTPMDPRSAFPLEMVYLPENRALVLKAHHAMIDATSGFSLLRDFGVALGNEIPKATKRPVERRLGLRAWVRGLRLKPRVPAVSLVTTYAPRFALRDEPVRYHEIVVDAAFARIAARARSRESTFSEYLASAVLSAMHDYSAARPGIVPERIGLMSARARSRAPESASFRADTCVVSLRSADLARAHAPATLRELRSVFHEPGHNDAALAALYLSRKVVGSVEKAQPQRFVHFTLSDLTGFGRKRSLSLGPLQVNDLRVLASPTSYDHAGMLVTRAGDRLRLVVVSHEGALDQKEILSRTLMHLGENER